MANGCLFALFGLGQGTTRTAPSATDSPMGEGEIHSGPAGYEGMGYSGGYAADYRAQFEESENASDAGDFYDEEH